VQHEQRAIVRSRLLLESSAVKAISIGCAIVLATAACSNQDDPVGLPREVTSAFEQAFVAKDAAKAAALFTKDAQIFQQDRPAVPHDEIESYLAGQMNPILMFDTTTEQTFVRGDLGVEIGSYKFRDTRRGADVENGKYIHIWRKEGGQWKLYRTMYSTDAPLRADVSVKGVEN
jgi:ketosteroid isomerase-like protein